MTRRTMTRPVVRAEPGLHLVLDEHGGILRSAPIRNAPAAFLQPPFLTPRRLKQITGPYVELILDVLRLDGRVVDSFGWPWMTEAFFDRPVVIRFAAMETVTIGRVETPPALRVVRVPTPRSAAFLLFSESRVNIGPDAKPHLGLRQGIALYSLVKPVPPNPPLPAFADHLRAQELPGPAPLVRPD